MNVQTTYWKVSFNKPGNVIREQVQHQIQVEAILTSLQEDDGSILLQTLVSLNDCKTSTPQNEDTTKRFTKAS